MHTKHEMHPHSLLAWYQEQHNLHRRKLEVVKEIIFNGQGTDREILSRLGRPELGQVQPRISDLIRDGVLVEVGEKSQAGKTVRIVDVNRLPIQARLI